MDWKEAISIFFKYCWLAIHPIRKSEEIMGVVGLIITFLIILGLIGAGVAGWIAPSPLPEPSPRWPLIVAYPTILFAILVFIAGLRLQFKLAAIERLEKIKRGSVIKNKEINVSLLLQKSERNIVDNVTFENCKLKGPCVVALSGTLEMVGCSFSNLVCDDMFIIAESHRRYIGAGGFLHCKFRYCTFDDLGFITTQGLMTQIRNSVTIT